MRFAFPPHFLRIFFKTFVFSHIFCIFCAFFFKHCVFSLGFCTFFSHIFPFFEHFSVHFCAFFFEAQLAHFPIPCYLDNILLLAFQQEDGSPEFGGMKRTFVNSFQVMDQSEKRPTENQSRSAEICGECEKSADSTTNELRKTQLHSRSREKLPSLNGIS